MKKRKYVYQEKFSDAKEWYAAYLSDDQLNQCIKITKAKDKTSSIYKWEEKFNKFRKEVVYEITSDIYKLDGQWTHGLLDSILIELDINSTKDTDNRYQGGQTETFPIFPLQTKLQTDCIQQAVSTEYDPFVKKKKCSTEENVIKFKLNERFAQDIFAVSGIGSFIEPTFNLN